MKQIDDAIVRGMEAAEAPGAVALIGDRDGVVYAKAFGQRGVADGAPMTLDTPFWFASMTKAVTSVAALQLVERGRLTLDDPIGALLPALAAPNVLAGFDAAGAPILRPARRAITLRHLLTHTSGVGYDFCSADLLRARGPGGPPPTGELAWLAAPLLFDPGERWEYGMSTDWVGLAVEAASGQTLDAYFAAHILGPLDMADTAFVADEARLAPLHARLPDGGLAPLPSMAASLAGGAFLSGGGGLFGTGGDYMRFQRAILGGGALDGVRILATETVAIMAANQIGEARAGAWTSAMAALSVDFDLFPGIKTGWGLGFLINPDPVPGRRAAGSLAWAGLANTHYWIDPASNLAGLILTQVFPFGDARVMALVAAFETAAYAAAANTL